MNNEDRKSVDDNEEEFSAIEQLQMCRNQNVTWDTEYMCDVCPVPVEALDEVLAELKHWEEKPFYTRNLFADDGEMKGKDWSQVTEDEFRGLFEYSDNCKCQGCSEIRYILHLRAQLASKPSLPEWISVDQELPPPSKNVAIIVEDANAAIHGWATAGFYHSAVSGWWHGTPGDYRSCNNQRWTVTHWAYLPKLPTHQRPLLKTIRSQPRGRSSEREK